MEKPQEQEEGLVATLFAEQDHQHLDVGESVQAEMSHHGYQHGTGQV